MRRLIFALIIALTGMAQAQYTTVSGSKLQDLDGTKLTGQVCFAPANNKGVNIGFRVGGGGQVTVTKKCVSVTNGSFSVSVADTSVTSPANVCYMVTANNAKGEVVLGPKYGYRAGQLTGYECVQPVGATWSFDDFTPAGQPGVVQVAGPQGPKGDKGDSGIGTDPNCHTDGNGRLICGSVGVGTASPGGDVPWASPVVDIHGTRGTAILRTTATNGISTLRFKGPDSTDDWNFNMYAGYGVTNGYLGFFPQAGSVTSLVLNKYGNVGIGVLTPASDSIWASPALDIYGTRATTILRTSGASGISTLAFKGPDQTDSWFVNMYAGSGTSNGSLGIFAQGGSVTAVSIDKSGNVSMPHTFSATTKNFVIPYPGDATRRLVHSSLEGPEIAVFYRGEARLTAGRATITLPTYFEALTQSSGRTVLLTPEYTTDTEPVSQLAASAVANGQFSVRATDTNNPGQKFFWELKAVRSDQPALQTIVPATTK